MSTATKSREGVQKLGEVTDELAIVRHKLAAVRAGCLGADGPRETEGLAWIVGDLETKVGHALDTLDGHLERLRKARSTFMDDAPSTEAKPEGPSVTYSGDRLRTLLEAMAATHEVVALLSDGAYEKVHGGPGAAKKAYHMLSPFTEEARDALGIDEEEEYEIVARILEDVSDFEEAS